MTKECISLGCSRLRYKAVLVGTRKFHTHSQIKLQFTLWDPPHNKEIGEGYEIFGQNFGLHRLSHKDEEEAMLLITVHKDNDNDNDMIKSYTNHKQT
jgi:hypothetical protein